MAMTKIKGLQLWCRKMTDGYQHVDINNFTTAWRDGMAFCAIIHRFRPDLIDYDSLSPDNVFDNCKLAFEVAERELDIPAFLEADDMARLKVPDKLSVITYVSQYYNFLHSLPQLGGPGVKGKVSNKGVSGTKRPPTIDTSQAPSTKKPATAETKENAKPNTEKSRHASTGDKCGICQERVYLLERHIESGKLYHRSCFRHSELSPTNKVFTRSPFLAPSLNTESPKSPPHTPTEKHTKDVKPNVSKTSLEITSTSHKAEGAGMKHSLEEPDREDSKKSKMQPKNLFGEDKGKNASAIKERLQNLKSKFTEDRKKDSEPALPLPFSSKEARKLEKRREEILASEKSAGDNAKGGKRNVPLIFQQKDSTVSDTSKNASSTFKTTNTVTVTTTLSSVSKSTAPATTLSHTTSKTSQSTITLKTSELKPATKSGGAKELDSETAVKTRIAASKDSQKPTEEKKVDTILRKKGALPDVQNLQKMFSGKSDSKAPEPQKGPVAKPRASAHVPSSDSHKDTAPTQQPSEHSTKSGKDTSIPKPAPRKSMTETSEKKKAPERPNHPPPLRKSTLHPESSTDETSVSPGSLSPRTPRTPPPLPKSAPPPLPTSAPPPLPASSPRGEIVPKVSEKSTFETKVTLRPKTPTEGSKMESTTAKSPRSPRFGKKSNQSAAKDKSQTKVADKDSSSEITTHAPVRSQVAVNTAVVAKTSSPARHSDRRFSAPISMDKEPVAVLVVPTEKKDEEQVKTGLLASLAGVRGRASSSPGSTSIMSPPVVSPTTSPLALVPESVPLSTSNTSSTPASQPSTRIGVLPSKTNPSTTSSASSSSHTVLNKGAQSTSVSSAQSHPNSAPKDSSHKTPEAINVLKSLKSVNDSTSLKTETTSHKTDVKLTKPEKLDSETKLSSSGNKIAHISKTDTKGSDRYGLNVSKPKETSKSAVNQTKDKAVSESGTKSNATNLKDGEKKSNDKNNIADTKLLSTHPTPAKRNSLIRNEQPIEQTSGMNKALSSSKENLTDVKLKRVLPEPKEVKKEPKTAAFDVKLKKVEAIKGDEKWNSAPSKPPRVAIEDDHEVSVTIQNGKSGGEEIGLKTSLSGGEGLRHDVKQAEGLPSADIASAADDIPQWKKDIEERKRKMRDDIAKSESDTHSNRYGRKNDQKSGAQTIEEDTPKKPPRSELSDRTKSSVVISSNISNTAGHKSANHGAHWQQEAEQKMAALAGFDSEEESKRSLPTSPVSPVDISAQHHGFSSTEKNGGHGSDQEQIVNIMKAPQRQNSHDKKSSKLKDSELEFVVNKTKLKPVEVDIDISSTENDSTKTQPSGRTENGQKEDFRVKLNQLRHVETEEGKKKDGKISHEISSGNVNNNSQGLALGDKISDKSHIERIAQKGKSLLETIPLESPPNTSDEDDKDHQVTKPFEDSYRNGSDKPVTSTTSPKVKKKITVLGRNHKGTIESPPPSPTLKKKIEISSKFDFDKSSEFEKSSDFEKSADVELDLTSSTAKLSISGKHTPPPRPPPPHPNHKVTSPSHISAIELQQQLVDIDKRLTDLELRGRDLEDSIRNESGLYEPNLGSNQTTYTKEEVNTLEEDDDKLMIEWFKLIGEKNELVRKEADLVYLSREQELEGEQGQIESQLRYLISKPEECKSPEEKQEEDYLIQRKIELVEQRNLIVDSMDEDRLRYEEEDRDIECILKDKGFWKDSTGTVKALKGKKVARSKFYA